MPDIPYLRPGKVRQYLSRHKHQKNAANSFSKWQCVNLEKETFDNADYGNIIHPTSSTDDWMDTEGNLWGFLSDFRELGTRREQFGFFPKTSNPPNEQWHGYPVIPFSGNTKYGENYGRDIPEEVIKRWVKQTVLPSNKVERLMRGKLL